jgi:hypothetical protein
MRCRGGSIFRAATVWLITDRLVAGALHRLRVSGWHGSPIEPGQPGEVIGQISQPDFDGIPPRAAAFSGLAE